MKKEPLTPLRDEVLIGVFILTFTVLSVIGFCAMVGFIINQFHAKPLNYAEIAAETDVCNKEGRISEASHDGEGNITKVWCGLPPYEDKRGWQ